MNGLVSPHTHCETAYTGSTIEDMVQRAIDLGRTHLSYTDHNSFTGFYKAYTKTKKAGIGFIPGVELYIMDRGHPLIDNTASSNFKYMKTTVYFKDQETFQAVSRLMRRNRVEVDIRGHQQKIYTIEDLEEISKMDTVLVTSDYQDIVSKHLIVNNKDACIYYYKKLREMFKDRFYVSLMPYEIHKFWRRKVRLKLKNGQEWMLDETDRLDTNAFKGVTPFDVANRRARHKHIKYLYVNGIKTTILSDVVSAKIIEGFYELEGAQDIQFKSNKIMAGLAKKFGDPIIMSDYAYFAVAEDKLVQDMKLEDTKFYAHYDMKSLEDMKPYFLEKMKFTEQDIQSMVDNSVEFSKMFDNFELKYDYRLPKFEGTSLEVTMDIIKKTGRAHLLKNPKYTERLKYEIKTLKDNGILDLLPYFFPIGDVLNYYKEQGELTGPSRGSAGGCLLMYLMGITQLDPLQYDLPFERFFSMDRIKNNNLPDVDVDLPHRELLVGDEGYLTQRWGNKWGQVSTRSLLKIKSAIRDVSRYVNGEITEEAEQMAKSLPAPPQGVSGKDAVFGFEDSSGHHVPGILEQSDKLQKYALKNPKDWDIISRALGVSRQISRHASAFIIADEDLEGIVPMMAIKDAKKVTQWESGEVESAGLIKYDFLCVSQLKDIQGCIDYINEKNKDNMEPGKFNHKGEELYIWDLPVDLEAYEAFYNGKTETTFQTNTSSMLPFVKRIKPKSIMDLATILALVRPGPLDFIDPDTNRSMAEEYMWRRDGKSKPKLKELAELLPETYGIIVFQEQITKVAEKLAGFSGPKAEDLRKYMCKKKKKQMMMLKPDFIEGAKKNVSEDIANAIWDQMETFAQYGFSIIHSVGYAMITYASVFLKHNYPMEWWAAILTNAKDSEINEQFWRYVKDIVAAPDINISREKIVIDYKNNKLRSKLSMITGLGNKAIQPIIDARPYKNIKDFVFKEVCGPSMGRKLVYVGVLDSLFMDEKDGLEKLQTYENAVEELRYLKKVRKKIEEKELNIEIPNDTEKVIALCKETPELKRLAPPKEGEIDPSYIGLSPLDEFRLKKSILPSMPLRLLDSMVEIGHKKIRPATGNLASKSKYVALGSRGHENMVLEGKHLKKIDDMDNVIMDIYFAAPGYVLKTEEFMFSNNTKKALKIFIDTDGYISEKVIWPDYDTGQLMYDENIKKGALVLVFYRKKPGKNYTNVTEAHFLS